MENKEPFRNSEEEVIIVDSETNEILKTVKRKEMRANNLWHRASFVFVENVNNQFIV